MKVNDTPPSIADLNQLHKLTYDSTAAEYDKRADLHEAIVEKAIVDNLVPYLKPPARVLDVGCAVGNVTKALAAIGYMADGIDISPAMIRFAKKRLPQSRFEVGDLMDYDPGYAYDAVVAFAFIHLFPRKEVPKILDKISTLLADGGLLYTGTTLSNTYTEGFETKADYGNVNQRYRARWTPAELEKELTEAGYEMVSSRTHRDGVGKTWMDYIVRKIGDKR